MENLGSFHSGSIYQSPSRTQDPTLSEPIDLESADDPVKLRKAALRNMALAGSNLSSTNERTSSSILPPPPDLPFYSKLKPISPVRRALMRDLMEETRRTLHYNPYTLVDLGKEPNLGLPMVYVNAVYEPYEYDLESEPELFREEIYECLGWALLDTAADCCYVCCDAVDITLERTKRYGGYFTIQYVSYLTDRLIRFAGVEGLVVEATAKLVNRESLPNHAKGINIIIGQRVFFFTKSALTFSACLNVLRYSLIRQCIAPEIRICSTDGLISSNMSTLLSSRRHGEVMMRKLLPSLYWRVFLIKCLLFASRYIGIYIDRYDYLLLSETQLWISDRKILSSLAMSEMKVRV